MKVAAWLVALVFITYTLPDVSCITNREFFELMKDYAEDIEEFEKDDPAIVDQDNDSDVIELPGNADDELDVEYLLTKLYPVGVMQNKHGIPSKRSLKFWGHIIRIVRHVIHRRSKHGSGHRGRRLYSPCQCHNDQCSCCLEPTFKVHMISKIYKFRVNGCAKLANLKGDERLSFAITNNGLPVFHHKISLKEPKAMCVGVPGLRQNLRACVEIYNVDFRAKRLCPRVAFITDIEAKEYRWNMKLGCFRVPFLAASEDSEARVFLENMEMSRERSSVEEISVSDLPALYRQLQEEIEDMN